VDREPKLPPVGTDATPRRSLVAVDTTPEGPCRPTAFQVQRCWPDAQLCTSPYRWARVRALVTRPVNVWPVVVALAVGAAGEPLAARAAVPPPRMTTVAAADAAMVRIRHGDLSG
jgi:hypothetical protein